MATLPESITGELRGHVDTDEVVRFYRDNYVDAFVSLSVSEGLPVSMMEAQSFGIPIVAVGVHGVPEIVNDATGVLLEPEATVEAMAEGLTTALDPDRFDRAEIRHFFSEHFEAGTNYNAFADALIALWEDQAPAA
jgi:glycosyltransferase involved in cell wall biosynthesis